MLTGGGGGAISYHLRSTARLPGRPPSSGSGMLTRCGTGIGSAPEAVTLGLRAAAAGGGAVPLTSTAPGGGGGGEGAKNGV